MVIKRKMRNLIGFIFGLYFVKIGKLEEMLQRIDASKSIVSFSGHNPNKILFEAIINWFFQKGFTFLSCEDLLNIFEDKGEVDKGVFLSFDDGWRDNLRNVVPVIKKYEIPATFFISTRAVEVGHFWFSVAKKYQEFLSLPLNELFRVSEERRRSTMEELSRRVEIVIDREAMNVQEIKSLLRIPSIGVGNHTDNHVICPNCTDRELVREVEHCNWKLFNWIGEQPQVFAYPKGKYDARVVKILMNLGFRLGMTEMPRAIQKDDVCLLLPRTNIMDDGTLCENLCHVFGIWQPYSARLKNIMKLFSFYDKKSV